jgi:hypothetical protein
MTKQQQHAIDAVKQALPPSDHKAWARRIVERKAANERISPTVQAMARRALGLEV